MDENNGRPFKRPRMDEDSDNSSVLQELYTIVHTLMGHEIAEPFNQVRQLSPFLDNLLLCDSP